MNKRLLLGMGLFFVLLLLSASAMADGYPESVHPYESNTDQTWTYTHDTSLTYMKVTFSSQTAFESGWDYLYVTDAEGRQMRYTGNALAGKTLYFKGNTITLRLTSDSSMNLYGFQITSIAAATQAEYETPRYTVANGAITSFSGAVSSLTIPSEVDGQTVTAIGSSVFAGNTGLTSVTIPGTVTSIGANAFDGCTELKTVSLPAGLTDIGRQAFYHCAALTSITLPNSLKNLGASAFYDCASLQTATLSSGLTELSDYTFYNCEALASITIPQGVTSLGRYVFSGCAALKSAALPASLTEIGYSAFYNCSALTEITIPNGVTSIGRYAFCGCSALKSAALPESLTEIGDSAFFNCSALTSVSIPNGVTSVGGSAFKNCTALETAVLSGSLTAIGPHTFYACAALKDIALPAGVTSVGDYAFYGCTSLQTAALSESLTEIGKYAFYNCEALTSVAMPNSVTSIGDYAYYYCTSLKTASLSAGLTSIGSSAFSNCSALTGVTIPDGVTSLGSYTFYYCSSLRTVTLSGSLTEIGACAFYCCKALTGVTIPQGVESLGRYAFYNCESLQTIIFQSSGVALEDYALGYCKKVTKVNVPITELGECALYQCDSLREVEFADSVEALSDKMLRDFKALMRVVFTVGQNSPIYPQLKDNGICYIVRETGETNQGNLPTDYLRGKIEYIVRTCIEPGMSEYEMALALHDWLVVNAQYDYTFSEYGADGVLLKGTGVCQSYTMGYKALLDYVGIENSTETGDNHVWNMICLDGDWYHIDVTWDDGGSTSDYEYFCVTNRHFEHLANHECYGKKHIATACKYNYRYRTGMIDAKLNEVRTAIANALENGDGVISVKAQQSTWGSRSDPWSIWTVSDFDVITAALVLQDETFCIDGRPVPMEIQPDEMNNYIIARIIKQNTDFTLPGPLTAIGEEAFAGGAMAAVALGADVRSIGARAFADCGNLRQISIPSGVTGIADDAFSGDSGLVVFGEKGSAAETFAKGHGFIFVPDEAQ